MNNNYSQVPAFSMTYNKRIPDFVYTSFCSEDTNKCNNICSNIVYSPVVDGFVHDPYNGKVFCPFGRNETMNKSIIGDQSFLNSYNIKNIPNYQISTWGRAPQLSPRPLARIGLTWETS